MIEGGGTESGAKWVALTRGEAETHRLYGRGGWLGVISFFTAIHVVLLIAKLILAIAGGPGSGYPLIGLIYMGFLGYLLYKWATVAPDFHKWLAGVAAATFLMGFSLAGYALETGSASDANFIATALATVLFAVVFLYALLSKRINITYRLRAKPAWLARQPGGAYA